MRALYWLSHLSFFCLPFSCFHFAFFTCFIFPLVSWPHAVVYDPQLEGARPCHPLPRPPHTAQGGHASVSGSSSTPKSSRKDRKPECESGESTRVRVKFDVIKIRTREKRAERLSIRGRRALVFGVQRFGTRE